RRSRVGRVAGGQGEPLHGRPAPKGRGPVTGRGVTAIVATGLLLSGCVKLLTPAPPELVARADAQLQSGNYRAAIALYDEFLQASPADPAALRVRATQSLLEALLQSETAVQAVQRGAFDFLTKPFMRDELRTKISRALSERRWARDRERLRAVGETLASSGFMERTLDAVAHAAVETTEADCCIVFLLE